MRPTRVAGFAVLLLTLPLPEVFAHEIVSDVTLQLLVRPEGRQVHALVRSPLEAMQETEFPITGPGYLDLAEARSSGVLFDAAQRWIVDNLHLLADGRAADLEIRAVRVSLPSTRAFASYETAMAHMTGDPLPADTLIPWRQAVLDVLLVGPVPSEGADLAIRPSFARLGLRVITVLRFVTPDGAVRPFELRGDPGLVRLDPRWHQAAWRFVQLGFLHILDGLDHLLFLFCLVIPLRRFRELVVVVTAFTVAHSVTLIAAAYGLAPKVLWFPPLVELLIAASIVYMAIENVLGINVRRRWLVTFAFGLVHGFGFSFVLQESLQFAGAHLLTSLLSFNVGVEFGQLLVLVLLVPLLSRLFRRAVAERVGTILLSALIAHSAWHWMSERATALSEYAADGSLVDRIPDGALPWIALFAVMASLAWRPSGGRRRAHEQDRSEVPKTTPTGIEA